MPIPASGAFPSSAARSAATGGTRVNCQRQNCLEEPQRHCRSRILHLHLFSDRNQSDPLPLQIPGSECRMAHRRHAARSGGEIQNHSHHHGNGLVAKGSKVSTAINMENLDRMEFLFAELKKRGQLPDSGGSLADR